MSVGTGGKVLLIAAALVIVVAGLRASAFLFLPLLTAGFVTVLNLPVVRWLRRRGLPRVVAILLAVLLDIAIFGALGGLLGGSLTEFYGHVPHYSARLEAVTERAQLWLAEHSLYADPDDFGKTVESMGVMELVAELFQSLANLVSNALLVVLLVLFMLIESGPWKTKLAYLVGKPTEDLPRFASAAREIQMYLLVKTGICLLTGMLVAGWSAVCGVDFPMLWGLLAFLLTYIPTLGPFLATVPPVAMALIELGAVPAIFVLSGLLVVNVVLGNFVEPRVMGRALGLSPLVVLVSMLFWGWLWGPVGALLAVPLTMVMKIGLANTEDLRWASVLLGSAEWLEQRRREWSDPVEDEYRRTLPPGEPIPEERRTIEELLEDDPDFGGLAERSVPG
ncbi:MAG: AI-2E family transporter [Sandaracinaceae bacterium]